MQLGMVGLGRMGANMVRRLMKAGHECVAYDRSADAVATLSGEGAKGAESLESFVQKLQTPRAVWIMVPAAVVDSTLNELTAFLAAGDIIIDGGNSYYVDDIRRAGELKAKPTMSMSAMRRRGSGARLLPDDWWRSGGGRSSGSNFQNSRTRARLNWADARSRSCRRHG